MLAACRTLSGGPPDVVCFLDADFSDHPDDLALVLAPVLAGAADVVIADRLGPAAEIRAELRPGALVIDRTVLEWRLDPTFAWRIPEATGWDLTYVEQPGLLHVYPLLPFIPEAKAAWRTTLEFLRC